jgi:ferric-dicitrate binding protein FerR (iron transport regulator)
VTVALREGLVQLTPAGGIPVRLKPGLQAVIQTASNSISVQPFNETETLAWMKEEYKLDNAPLSDLALILPHWLGIQVEIKDPRVAAVRFSGTILKSESIDSLSHRLQRLTGLTAVYQNGVLKISSTSKAQ